MGQSGFMVKQRNLPGGSKNRNVRNPPKFTKSSVFNSFCNVLKSATSAANIIKPATYTFATVDEIEVASSLNFSILVECSVLNACECVDFVTEFRGSR